MTTAPKIVVICGPTATGKTNLALKLARKFKGEIISADSRQVYKELDIGSGRGRPDKNVMVEKDGTWIEKGTPIHLYNLLKPSEQITVIHFMNVALTKIDEIVKRGKIPLLVGGTGFYINAILGDTEIEDIPPNPNLRKALELLSQSKLEEKLTYLSPAVATQTDLKNKRRVIRAIEREEYRKEHPELKTTSDHVILNPLMIGLTAEATILNQRIDERTEQMLKEGLLDEVKLVLLKYGPEAPALDAIGYRQFLPYLLGEQSLDQAILAKNTAEHQYAKRQMTWFKRDERIKWFDVAKRLRNPQSFDQKIIKLVESYLEE